MKERYKASIPGEEPKYETPYFSYKIARRLMKAQLKNSDPELARFWVGPVLAELKNGVVIDFQTREKIA